MKKPKRVVLATGYPWFFDANGDHVYNAIKLTASPVANSILLRGGEKLVPIPSKGFGNWNKVRLVLEVLK